MAGSVKGLVLLALVGSVGIMFVVLACALPQYENWWPCFVVVFYMLAPLPYCIARRHTEDTGGSNACMELAVFLTTGIVVSAFGLPIVLAHAPVTAPVIQWGACALVFTGNIVIFLTILAFFVSFDNESDSWSYF